MFAVVFIPNFSLQSVLRHEPDLRSRAVALIDTTLPKPCIVQLTTAAREQGVCEGLTGSQAMARCEQLAIKTRSLFQEEAATEVLLQTVYGFSPNIESTASGVCTMELKGLGLHLNQGLESWATRVREALGRFYLDTQIGFAATPALTLLAARRARPVLKLEGELPSFPISALGPSPDILEILPRWGIRTVGEFLALGKDAVVERLGPGAMELFDLVAADATRPLQLVAPPTDFAEQMEFENEIETIEPLLFVLRRFVEQLSRRIESVYQVIAEFHLRLGLVSGDKHERVFRIPAPTSQVETLFRMLQTHLENVRTDSPIASIRLGAKPCNAETHQFGLFETTLRDPNQFGETLARLTALCGPDRVGIAQLESTHRPDAFRMQTPEFGAGQTSRPAPRNSDSVSPEVRVLPLRRFRPPLPAHIEFRDQQPALLRTSIFTGAISQVRGPFLSSGQWWDHNRWAREEWDVQSADGTLYRVFRSHEGCFMEGVYD